MIQKEKYDISFIIVSWNVKDYLSQCIRSIQETVHGLTYEIIVVDNASFDGSIQMIRDEFPQILLLVNQINSGFSDANNRGISASSGRYLCLLNPDVKVLPNSIEKLIQYICVHPEIGILGPKVLNGDLSLQPSCRTLPTISSSIFRALMLDTKFKKSQVFAKHYMTNWDYKKTREVDILSGCFWLINREAIKCIGTLDTRYFMYGEDMDFCKRFKEAHWKVVFFHEAEIIHYGGASSGKNPARFWVEMQRANLQYWLKHYGKAFTIAYYASLLLHNLIRIVGFGLQMVAGLWENQKARIRFNTSWCGLKWLLSIRTLRSLMHGEFDHGGRNR